MMPSLPTERSSKKIISGLAIASDNYQAYVTAINLINSLNSAYAEEYAMKYGTQHHGQQSPRMTYNYDTPTLLPQPSPIPLPQFSPQPSPIPLPQFSPQPSPTPLPQAVPKITEAQFADFMSVYGPNGSNPVPQFANLTYPRFQYIWDVLHQDPNNRYYEYNFREIQQIKGYILNNPQLLTDPYPGEKKSWNPFAGLFNRPPSPPKPSPKPLPKPLPKPIANPFAGPNTPPLTQPDYDDFMHYYGPNSKMYPHQEYKDLTLERFMFIWAIMHNDDRYKNLQYTQTTLPI
jgi:hypothetical protein